MEISHDLARLDFRATSDLLIATYWGGQRTEEINRRAFANSICAIALIDGRQVGFARASGDRAVFARGAVKAALWGIGQAPGEYDMLDVLGLNPA